MEMACGIVLNVCSTHSGMGRKTEASHLRQLWARRTQPQLQVTDSPPSSEEERHQVSVEEEDGLKDSRKKGCSEQSCGPDAGVCVCV